MNREYIRWENDKEVSNSIRSVLQTNLPQLLHSRLIYRLAEGEWILSLRLWTFVKYRIFSNLIRTSFC